MKLHYTLGTSRWTGCHREQQGCRVINGLSAGRNALKLRLCLQVTVAEVRVSLFTVNQLVRSTASIDVSLYSNTSCPCSHQKSVTNVRWDCLKKLLLLSGSPGRIFTENTSVCSVFLCSIALMSSSV